MKLTNKFNFDRIFFFIWYVINLWYLIPKDGCQLTWLQKTNSQRTNIFMVISLEDQAFNPGMETVFLCRLGTQEKQWQRRTTLIPYLQHLGCIWWAIDGQIDLDLLHKDYYVTNKFRFQINIPSFKSRAFLTLNSHLNTCTCLTAD